MEQQLIKLYYLYLNDLSEWNLTKHPLEDEKEPEFESFMRWLTMREEDKKTPQS